MENLIVAVLVVVVSICCFEMIGNAAESGQKFPKNFKRHHFCHRCSMTIKKTDEEALRFQKQHGGEIMAFQEAVVNMDKVMKKIATTITKCRWAYRFL